MEIMSIDDATLYMELYKRKLFDSVSDLDKDTEAYDIAIATMQKYQKIQEVMDSRPDDDAKSNSKALGEIEVIMYGNDD